MESCTCEFPNVFIYETVIVKHLYCYKTFTPAFWFFVCFGFGSVWFDLFRFGLA